MEAPHLLTAGWDGLIGVWDLTPGVNEEEALESNGERSKKKRRKSQVSSNIKNKVSFLLVSSRTRSRTDESVRADTYERVERTFEQSLPSHL